MVSKTLNLMTCSYFVKVLSFTEAWMLAWPSHVENVLEIKIVCQLGTKSKRRKEKQGVAGGLNTRLRKVFPIIDQEIYTVNSTGW